MYERELTELSKSGARYLVIGAIAMGFQNYIRATSDLDLMIDTDEKNIRKISNVLKKIGYVPRVPVNPEELEDPKKREMWYKEKNMKAFSFMNTKDPFRTVDILIYSPLNFDECFERKDIIEIYKTGIPVASIEDLLKLKKIAGREKDKEDIKILEKLR
jgi:predicted nucleotidyltransferase